MKTACNRGVICCMILKDKTLQQDAQTEGAWSSSAHRWAEWSSRLVIRRIQSGQIISVVTASSHHPHFASHLSESFDRNLDIPGIEYRETDADNPAQAETRVSASRAFAVNQCAGGRVSTSRPTAMRDAA